MANKRVFYAAKKAGIGPVGSAHVKNVATAGLASKGAFQQIHGLNSVGITTTFNLEQTFELGQLAIYENIEGIPDVSIDTEKQLDGYAPVYILATSKNGNGVSETGDNKASGASLVGRSKAQCDFCLAIYKDTGEYAQAGSGIAQGRDENPETHVMMSGVFANSVSYTVGVDGYATETCTMVGQDKVWHGIDAGDGTKLDHTHRALWSATDFIMDGVEDQPLSLTQGSGGVNRREDVLFVYPGNAGGANDFPCRDVNGAVSGLGTVLPTQIPGISVSGTNDKVNDEFNAHITNFSCSTDFGREDIFELGRRGRYHRFVPFPTEVSCEITVVSTSGDLISATEEGFLGDGQNLRDESIRLHLREGLLVDLGKKNKLASVSVTGGDAGGGNEEVTYSYTNFNDFTVYHPQDPQYKKPNDGADYKSSTFTPRDGRSTVGPAVL